MKFKQLGTFAILAVCLFALAMGGCGTDDPPVEEPIQFVSASPAEGSTIQNDATITVTFDGTPEGLQVTGGSAIPGSKTVTIAGPFAAGPLVLGLQWEGDGVVLSYTVAEPPAAIINVDPPEGSTIDEYYEIWVTFDSPPARVWVTPGNASVHEDNSVSIYGPFDPGLLELTIGWDDEEHTIIYNVSPSPPPDPPAAFLAVTPSSGSVIARNETINVLFDNVLSGVWVSQGTVTVASNAAIITGPFTPGPLVLTIGWDDGSHTFNYTVEDFFAPPPDNTAPMIIGGTFGKGEFWLDVDPERINTDAVIEIEFSENVDSLPGQIRLNDDGGDDVGWHGSFQDNLAILELVKGKELGWGTTYVIEGWVSDPAGNALDFRITFVTKGKE